jgi:ABC-type transport system involved in cytochrome c biogenesis permease component
MNSISIPATKSNFFARCWSGKARLWQAFWLCGVAGKFLLIAFIAALAPLVWHGQEDNMLVDVLFGGMLIAFLIFSSVSIWRCAPNVSLAPLGALARVVVVFSLASWVLAAAHAL